jgi:nucleoside-diphosphate-sugar epimerase
MKLFLTGGTGFIGSNFINQAHSAGHSIVAIRRSFGSKPRVELEKEPTWVSGTLDNDFKMHLEGCDVFVHLASHSTNPPYDSLANCLYWNVYASMLLAEQALEVGIKNYLLTGSCFEYGTSADLYPKIPTSAPLKPLLSYPISKAAASISFEGFCAEHSLKVKLCRLFQVYGYGESKSRFWPSLHAAAMEGRDFSMTLGEQLRDFIDVKDVARKLVDELDFAEVRQGQMEVQNIGSGNSQTLREFALYWWGIWGAIGKLKFGDVPYRRGELMRLVPELKGR